MRHCQLPSSTSLGNTDYEILSLGGHSWAAWSVRDEALLIDLGNLKYLELNEASGSVIASPSTTGRVLNEYLGTKGKMFAGGHCPDVGLGI
jgi:FAD/FMN-containing dehydrogenase